MLLLNINQVSMPDQESIKKRRMPDERRMELAAKFNPNE